MFLFKISHIKSNLGRDRLYFISISNNRIRKNEFTKTLQTILNSLALVLFKRLSFADHHPEDTVIISFTWYHGPPKKFPISIYLPELSISEARH